jgi:hypothetical protein
MVKGGLATRIAGSTIVEGAFCLLSAMFPGAARPVVDRRSL